jgi:transcriptional regulator with XRE-family HTH domain
METPVKTASRDGLARRIRSARRALGLAQGAFDGRIGVTRNMVIRYERSQAVPRRAVLARIAREGHVTVEWLLGEADERRRGDMEWEEALRALRAIWPNAEKWRQVMEVLQGDAGGVGGVEKAGARGGCDLSLQHENVALTAT